MLLMANSDALTSQIHYFLQLPRLFSIQFAGVVLPRLPYTWHSLEKFLQHILFIAFEK